ncbi:TPA: HipA family kinase [Aeromonas veronii]
MKVDIEQVKVGTMLPGGKPINDNGNINATFKAHVKTHKEVIVAYVKLIPEREIYIECVCAIIGRALGLPIPLPLIVKVDHDALNSIPLGEYKLAFGSEDSAYPSLKRRGLNDELIDKLSEVKKTLNIGVFDEWIANPDRHGGNILFDGSSDFVFIDHGLSIPKGCKSNHISEKNIIIDSFYKPKSEFEKYKINRDAQSNITPQYSNIPFTLISEKTYGTSYLSDEDVVAVIDFLEERSCMLNTLLEQRLCLQQQELAL